MDKWNYESKHSTQSSMVINKVRPDSSTEFGLNPILIVQIHTALDCAVDFSERITAFTTGRACTPSSNIKGGKDDIQLRCRPVHTPLAILHLVDNNILVPTTP